MTVVLMLVAAGLGFYFLQRKKYRDYLTRLGLEPIGDDGWARPAVYHLTVPGGEAKVWDQSEAVIVITPTEKGDCLVTAATDEVAPLGDEAFDEHFRVWGSRALAYARFTPGVRATMLAMGNVTVDSGTVHHHANGEFTRETFDACARVFDAAMKTPLDMAETLLHCFELEQEGQVRLGILRVMVREKYPLPPRAAEDPDPEVRVFALQQGAPEALLPFVRDPAVPRHARDAALLDLGKRGGPELARKLLGHLLQDHDIDSRWLAARLARTLLALDALPTLQAWALEPTCPKMLLYEIADMVAQTSMDPEAFFDKLLDVETQEHTLCALQKLATFGSAKTIAKVQTYEKALWRPHRLAAAAAVLRILASMPAGMDGAISVNDSGLGGSLSEPRAGTSEVLLQRK